MDEEAALAAGDNPDVEAAGGEAESAESAADRATTDLAASQAENTAGSKATEAAAAEVQARDAILDEKCTEFIQEFFEKLTGKEMTKDESSALADLNTNLKEIILESIGEKGNPADPSRASSQKAAAACINYEARLTPEMQAASDAQMQACQSRAHEVVETLPGLDANKLKALRDGLGPMKDSWKLSKDGKTATVIDGSPYDKASKLGDGGTPSEIDKAQADIENAVKNDPKMKAAADKVAAKDGTKTGEELLEKITKILKILAVVGSIGFATWFAFQYAHDNTGCFSYVGSLGANKMTTCSTTLSHDKWAPTHCNCSGNFTAGEVSSNPLTCPDPGCAKESAPPNACSLGGPQQKIAGGSYAACTTDVAEKKSVLYAYKEMSPLQALAALPKFLGDFGKGFLPDTNSLKGVLKMILYAGLGILGAIILLMIIRFSWNYFKTHRDIGKKKEGSGNKSSGMRTRSRR